MKGSFNKMSAFDNLLKIYSMKSKIEVIKEFCEETKETLEELEKELNEEVFGK